MAPNYTLCGPKAKADVAESVVLLNYGIDKERLTTINEVRCLIDLD